MGRFSNHIHAWNSLLERAGFTLAHVPQGWEAFWSFWCDRVQPAVRKALGREDVWAVGLPMSAAAIDTEFELFQFQLAYQVAWLGPRPPSSNRRSQGSGGHLRRSCLHRDLAQGLHAAESANWTNIDNNKAFLAQTVVMTANPTLSIPAALRTARPTTITGTLRPSIGREAANGEPLVLEGRMDRAVVFKDGGQGAAAERFVRFLAERGLAHWVDVCGDL